MKEQPRNIVHLLIYLAVFAVVTALFGPVSRGPLTLHVPDLMGTGLYLRLDMFRYIFVWLTAFLWPAAMLYSIRHRLRSHHRRRYYNLYMLTYASTLGMFLSENILNLFTFYEVMAVASYFLVIHNEDDYAHRAGASYLTISIVGGLLLLLGILLAYNYTGTLLIPDMDLTEASRPTRIAIGSLLLVGFGFKAGLYPLHFWLAKTYTAAPMSLTIVLSGVLAKTGIFGMILTLHYVLGGDRILSYSILFLSMATILTGGFLALCQRNVKRLLAYSSMSQMGYMLMGFALIEILGSHGAIALHGTLAHVVNHGIIKALLFMIVGILYNALGEYSLNDIGGAGRRSPWLKGLFLFGALALAGVPGGNGYASKTLLHDALLEAAAVLPAPAFHALNLLFYLGSALTVAYLLKIYVALFVEGGAATAADGSGVGAGESGSAAGSSSAAGAVSRRRPGFTILLPMLVLAAAILLLGVFPLLFDAHLAPVAAALAQAAVVLGVQGDAALHLASPAALVSEAVVLLLGVALYLVVVRRLLRRVEQGVPVYTNPTDRYFKIEDHLIVPLSLGFYRLFLWLFHTLDHWVVASFRFLQAILDLALRGSSEMLVKVSTHPEEAAAGATEAAAGRMEEEAGRMGLEPAGPAPGPVRRFGAVPARTSRRGDWLPPLRGAAPGIVPDGEGESTRRATFFRPDRRIDPLTYAVFTFGGILVLSLLFVFLSRALLPYQ